MRRNDHFVEFYSTDEALVHNVAGFVADGLWQNERGIVIATPEHRQALEARLQARGIDIATAIATGQYLALDAAETLGRFMVGDRPDPVRFDAVVGTVVRQATEGGRTLRAFGEMVALLWTEGNARAALVVERLWNDLARTRDFALYCAYPQSCAAEIQAECSGEDICCIHTAVIPPLPA